MTEITCNCHLIMDLYFTGMKNLRGGKKDFLHFMCNFFLSEILDVTYLFFLLTLDQCNLSAFYHIGVKSVLFIACLQPSTSYFLPSDHYSLYLPYGSLHFKPTIRLWSDCQDSESVNGKGYKVAYTEKLIRSCQAYGLII